MNINKQKLFHEERETWLRTLDYIQQENIHLKNLLADIVKSGISNQSLDEVEYFQNQFLNKDAIIALLRRDIAMQKSSEDKNTQKHDKLRADIDKMEKEFSNLKFNFNNYIASFVQAN